MFPCVLHHASYFSVLLWKQLGEIFNGLLSFLTSFCSLTRLPGGGNEKHAWKTRQPVSVNQLLKLGYFLFSHKYRVRWTDTWSGLLPSWYFGVRGRGGGNMWPFSDKDHTVCFLIAPLLESFVFRKLSAKACWTASWTAPTQPHAPSEHKTLVLVALHGSEAENSH